jgi:hypothetical protein
MVGLISRMTEAYICSITDTMIDEYAPDDATDTSALYDVARITQLLQEAASQRRALSYSEMLGMMGFRFSRPKMRTLCKTMETVDAQARGRNQPELAVLVVRESDRLPGQGWWTGRRDYQGQWTGAEARAFIDSVQAMAFDYWAEGAS